MGRMVHLAPLLILAVLPGPEPGPPPSAAAAVVAYREAVMKSLSGHMKALGLIAAGQVGYAAHATLHASAIAEIARVLPELFPAGSGPDRVKTDALPAVWTDAAGFAAAAARLQSESGRLDAAARAGAPGSLRQPAANVGKACTACHEGYRVAR